MDDELTDELTPDQPPEPTKAPRKSLDIKGHGRRALVLVVVPLVGLALVFFMVYLIKDLIDDSETTTTTDNVAATEPATEDEPEQADAPDEVPAESAAEVCSDVANLRSGPGTDHEIVGTVSRGDELLTSPSDTDGWLQLAGSDTYISTITLCD